MNKHELIKKIAERSRLSHEQAESAFNSFRSVLTELLKNGDSLDLVGFGSFRVVDRAERTARNLKTGTTIKVPPRKAVVFKPGKALQELFD